MARMALPLTVISALVLVAVSPLGLYALHRQGPARAATSNNTPKNIPNTKGKASQASSLQTRSTGVSYQKAFVIDDRLSALRREPSLQSQVIRRLRLGHAVYIVGSSVREREPRFFRVAVTRRTRGWIHASALAVQNRPAEDQRIMKVIETTGDGFDRIGLCRIIIEHFGRSPLVPRTLLLLGEEADRAAETLTQRSRKRLAELQGNNATRLRDYYLTDAGLDRYSKLHIVFDFNESIAEFVYDGTAYREIVRRFPDREEATLARQRLELMSKKMARR